HLLSSTSPLCPSLSPLSLHDALPILGNGMHLVTSRRLAQRSAGAMACSRPRSKRSSGSCASSSGISRWKQQKRSPRVQVVEPPPDRKSTRLNSSHVKISYAVFCLKKK